MKSDRLLVWYRVAYAFGFLCLLPWMMWNQFIRKKPQNFWKRLFPSVAPVGPGPLIWVHAVSVGEVHAATPIVAALRAARPNLRFIISTTTHSGQSVAKKALPDAAAHLFLPFDFKTSVWRALRLGTPQLVLFSEGDVWPCFASEVRRRGAFVAVINGKVSEASARRLLRWPAFGRWLYSFVDLFCVQSKEMADRYRALGLPEQAIHVTGNTKADVSVSLLSESERQSLRTSLGLSPSDRAIVLGSTHESEEEGISAKLGPILAERPGVRLIVVPRHPERFSQVVDLMSSRFGRTVRLSTYSGHEPWDVLVVDKLGLLSKLYQIASMAIVCGSFIEPIGGHNILEPAVVGTPTIVGPFMHSQQMLFESAVAASAVIQATYDTLPFAVAELLDSADARNRASTTAADWASSQRGATERTVRLLSSSRLLGNVSFK